MYWSEAHTSNLQCMHIPVVQFIKSIALRSLFTVLCTACSHLGMTMCWSEAACLPPIDWSSPADACERYPVGLEKLTHVLFPCIVFTLAGHTELLSYVDTCVFPGIVLGQEWFLWVLQSWPITDGSYRACAIHSWHMCSNIYICVYLCCLS